MSRGAAYHEVMPTSPDPVSFARRLPFADRPGALGLLAAMAFGAAAIHIAAGPAHVEELGDVGLAFYWAALFQAGLGLALIRVGAHGPGTWLTLIGVAGSAGISLLWLVSRTVGLPFLPGGPESVGTADVVATIPQVGLIAGLVAAGRGPLLERSTLATRSDAAVRAERAHTPRSRVAGLAMAAAFAAVALGSSIGVVDAAAGHAHGPDFAGSGQAIGTPVDRHSDTAADHAPGSHEVDATDEPADHPH